MMSPSLSEHSRSQSSRVGPLGALNYSSNKEATSKATHVTAGPRYFEGLEVGIPPRPPQDHEIPEAFNSSRFLGVTSERSRALELPEKSDVSSTREPLSKHKPWYRKRIVIVVAVLLLAAVVIAAAIGGVLGTKHSHKESSSAATSSVAGSSDPPSTSSEPSALRNDSSIAAISYIDSSGLTQRRLYYQDPRNNILESAWNSTGKTWYTSDPSVGVAKQQTPIAASVIRPADIANDTSGNGIAGEDDKPIGPQTNLYYLAPGNTVVEVIYDAGSSSPEWVQGSLTGTVVAEGSRLATIWQSRSSCQACPNTRLLVYESSKGGLAIINGTHAAGTIQDQYDLNTTALPGTGLGIALSLDKPFMPGLRLYYQTVDGHIVSHDWETPEKWKSENAYNYVEGRPDNNGWQNREFKPLDPVPLNAANAVWSSGSQLPNGLQPVVQNLWSSSAGIYAKTWVGTGGGAWLPLVAPPVFANVRKGSNMAATHDGHVFAVVDGGGIGEWWVDSDGTTWHGGKKAVTM
ncbi:MAG: hypothetical protein Q9227_008666 [Pyrenula ochraceoflavens]